MLKTINTNKLKSNFSKNIHIDENNNENKSENNKNTKSPIKKESLNNLEERFDLYLGRNDSKNNFRHSEINEKNINTNTVIQSNYPFSEREVTLREEQKFIESLRKIFLFQELSEEIL
jgi:hypothetical protein